MNEIVRHIERLIIMHQCVVIPRLGALLAHHESSHILPTGEIVAPRRTYSFNAMLSASDGMLEQSVARAQGISYERASHLVAEEVDAMLNQLHTQGSLPLGRVGMLRYDGAVISFAPSESDMLTPMAAWLPTLPALPLAQQAEELPASDSGRIVAPVARWKRYVRAGVAVAAVVAVAIVASSPIRVDNVSYASTSVPAISAPQTAYVPSTEPLVLELRDAAPAPVVIDTAARAEWQRVHLNPDTTVEAPAEVQPVLDNEAYRLSDSDNFFVVVASLTTRSDAERFIAGASRKYAGSLKVLEQGHRYRVYAASGRTTDQARKALNGGLAKQFAGAWICER